MGYSRHKTRERQENYFGIESMISALCLLCPGKCGFAHTPGGGGGVGRTAGVHFIR
jgi:hypothetical protein